MSRLLRALGSRAQHPARRLRHRLWDDFVFIHINKTGGSSVETALRLALEHKTAREKVAELGRAEWDRRFTFSVVRNPWDKVVSHYHYRVETNQTGLRDHPLPFPEWVRRAYGERDPAYHDQPRMFMPQTEWLADDEGRLLVDEVCRFESLGADFARVAERLGTSVRLPHVKASRRGSYAAYYTDETAAIVATCFADDIAHFGYRFDAPPA